MVMPNRRAQLQLLMAEVVGLFRSYNTQAVKIQSVRVFLLKLEKNTHLSSPEVIFLIVLLSTPVALETADMLPSYFFNARVMYSFRKSVNRKLQGSSPLVGGLSDSIVAVRTGKSTPSSVEVTPRRSFASTRSLFENLHSPPDSCIMHLSMSVINC